MNPANPEISSDPTRRDFVTATALGALALANPAFGQPATEPSATVPVRLTINGKEEQLTIEPRVTLLDALREQLQLTGTKKGCDHGQCGACTVLINGRRINSCLALAIAHQNDKVVTIEGLAQGDQLHPMQAAFLEQDGYQCGYCTPGQICSAIGVLEEARAGMPSQVTADLGKTGPIALNDEEIRERMSGNLCRCGAYPNIVRAVRAASQRTGA